MNGSSSPVASFHPVKPAVTDSGDTATPNGHHSPEANSSPDVAKATRKSPPSASLKTRDQDGTDAPGSTSSARHVTTNGVDDDAASEAETLIDSPVKKRELENTVAATRVEKPAKSRIGGLPVPNGDDEGSDSMASPMQSTEVSDAKGSPEDDTKGEELDEMDLGSSESLSSPHSSPSDPASRSPSGSPALSEHDQHLRNGDEPANPLKRKHRASSVGLPNKRQSMEPPKRQLRGIHSEGNATRQERSLSPRLVAHRRAVSTQATPLDGVADNSSRKRKAVTQFPVRDPKSAKATWEESDASSETTSHGHTESRRPQRGVGRSTSTPGGKANVREHKRHINKYGFTRLAEACEAGDMDLVKEWRDKDPDQLEVAEYADNKPLQIAALNGNAEVVQYLIDQGCQLDCANVDKDTPLIDAAENGHVEVVRVLLNAGVDPLRQNLKGQQALDVVTDDTDNADGIRTALRRAIESWNSDDAKQRREEEEELRHRAGPTKELHFMARTYENLLRLVTINDRNGVREFLDARVPVDNNIIAAAAKTGDLYLVNMLLAEMTEKKAYQKAEKPMSSVLGTSHWEMVKALTELDQFNPIYRSRAGKTWPELAIERNGPNWRQEKELLQRLYDVESSRKARHSSSPVTKRENGIRRLAPAHEDDESDDEDAPRRKNGRRLLSRRDMRAASGKASDSDSDMSDSEDAMGEEVMEEAPMRPPGSPLAKRGPGRPRTHSSSSSQPRHTSPKSARRMSSSRVLPEHVLPTVEEKPEEKPETQIVCENSHAEEAKFALEQAQRLDAKRKEEEQAEAEAKKAEEAFRLAEEERQAEESRLRREKEARQAEEALRLEEERREKQTREEEERKKLQAQLDEARQKHRAEILDALPPVLHEPLDTASDFDYDGLADRRYLIEHFTLLWAVKKGNVNPHDSPPATTDDNEDLWVLNAQVAPLFGKHGLELLLDRNSTGFEPTFSHDWTIFDAFSSKQQRSLEVIASHLVSSVVHPGFRDDFDWAEEREWMAQRYNASAASKRRLLDGTVPLYCVKLVDVWRHLHPLLKGVPFDVRSFVPLELGSSGQVLARRFVDGRLMTRSAIEKHEVGTLVVHEK